MKRHPSFADIKIDNNYLWKFRKHLKDTQNGKKKCKNLLRLMLRDNKIEEKDSIERTKQILDDYDMIIKGLTENIKFIKIEANSSHPSSIG